MSLERYNGSLWPYDGNKTKKERLKDHRRIKPMKFNRSAMEEIEKNEARIYFFSDVDGKCYKRLNQKSSIRYNYLSEILGRRVLKLHPKKRGSEKIPIEAGYSLDFNKGIYSYKEGIETPITQNWLVMNIDGEKFDSYYLSEYYSSIIEHLIQDEVIGKKGTTFVSSPPVGGLTYEVMISSMLSARTKEFRNSINAIPFHGLYEQMRNPLMRFNEQEFYDAYNANVIVCDDCLITGKAVRSEARKIADDNFCRKYGVFLGGIVVGVDCGLYGKSKKRVSEELRDEFGVPVESIVHMEEVMDFLTLMIERTGYPIKDSWPPKDVSVEQPKSIYESIYEKETRDLLKEYNRLFKEYRFSLDKFEREVRKPFVRFMKRQKQFVDLDKTVRSLRNGN